MIQKLDPEDLVPEICENCNGPAEPVTVLDGWVPEDLTDDAQMDSFLQRVGYQYGHDARSNVAAGLQAVGYI